MSKKITMYSALYKEYHPFYELYDDCCTVSDPSELGEGPGFLVLWGGADIHPSIYKAKTNPLTYVQDQPSLRDRAEINLANAAIDLGMLVVGVCRGAQLMCALSGGKLVQHVTGHQMDHPITTRDGATMKSSSLHHQMMVPWDIKHDLIAWSTKPMSMYYDGIDKDDQMEPPGVVGGERTEPEIVYLPKTKSLCIQGHPEYGTLQDQFVIYCNQLIRGYLNVLYP